LIDRVLLFGNFKRGQQTLVITKLCFVLQVNLVIFFNLKPNLDSVLHWTGYIKKITKLTCKTESSFEQPYENLNIWNYWFWVSYCNYDCNLKTKDTH